MLEIDASFSYPQAINAKSNIEHPIHPISLDTNSKKREKRLPQAIIIGTRKSGTRALLKFLEVNPSIRSGSKEIHFFDREENYKRGLDWYKDQMPETAEHEITIEKSPAYFVTRVVPERMKAMNSSIKLIVIFRNPVTRLVSDYSQLIANRLKPSPGSKLSIGNRSDAMLFDDTDNDNIWRSAELAFEKHVLTPGGAIDEQRRMVRTGMYSMYLERWLAVFQRYQFHFVDGERLIIEPHSELQKLEKFLGVRSTILPKHFVYIPRKGFYCLTGANITYAPRGNGERSGGPICLSRSKGRRHVTVTDELKRKLADFYAPYNEYLFSMTDINLNRTL